MLLKYLITFSILVSLSFIEALPLVEMGKSSSLPLVEKRQDNHAPMLPPLPMPDLLQPGITFENLLTKCELLRSTNFSSKDVPVIPDDIRDVCTQFAASMGDTSATEIQVMNPIKGNNIISLNPID